MSIKDKLMKIAGKGDFELDPQIRTLYIVRLCVKYGCMLIKGGQINWISGYCKRCVYRLTC